MQKDMEEKNILLEEQIAATQKVRVWFLFGCLISGVVLSLLGFNLQSIGKHHRIALKRKESSHVHMKLHAFGKWSSESEVVYWWKIRSYSHANCVYVLIMQVYVMLFAVLYAQARAYKNLLYGHWISTLDLHRYVHLTWQQHSWKR